MPRTFAYVRVSTDEQTTDNQILEIEAAGFTIEPQRIITEVISGSAPIDKRPGFARLLDRMERGDILVVTKLDRLGRNAIDVANTVARLEEIGIKIHCLALGGMDLTSSAGKMTMHVINAVAQFERDLLIERTRAGMKRAKAQGKRVGRPPILDRDGEKLIEQALASGQSVASIARDYAISRQTVMRIRDAKKPR
jgi:putative DNA-invertase from lambdoid prophage Rac